MLAADAALVAINSDAIGSNAAVIVLSGSCAVIGALAVSRQPRNLVGWLFLATGVVAALQNLPGELAIFMYRHGGPLLSSGSPGRKTGDGFSPLDLFFRCLCFSPRPPPVSPVASARLARLGVDRLLGRGIRRRARTLRQPARGENPAGVGPSGSFASLVTSLALFVAAATCVLCVCSLFTTVPPRRWRRTPAGQVVRPRRRLHVDVLAGRVGRGRPGRVRWCRGRWSRPSASWGRSGRRRDRQGPCGSACSTSTREISKTIVYGSLAAFIAIVYVGLVAGVGQLAESIGTPALSGDRGRDRGPAFQPAPSPVAAVRDPAGLRAAGNTV